MRPRFWRGAAASADRNALHFSGYLCGDTPVVVLVGVFSTGLRLNGVAAGEKALTVILLPEVVGSEYVPFPL
ncbi:MAG: hypothetical protein KGJ62_05430 [Armatimonadetes bacterium]|nr:hypothetical protein [Armatimonadota bacterium]MDE2206636.1 hypothetical protein [Armatimonadota bacterium]